VCRRFQHEHCESRVQGSPISVLRSASVGHETTGNLIANGVLTLLVNTDQLRRLLNDPALIKSAVEELLHFNGPLETATERYAREDIVVAGSTIPRGEFVLAVLAAANRDVQQFTDPDRLDLAREPNRHLAFGYGVHYCLGAPLARLEGQIAIGTRRIPDLRLARPVDALRWKRGLVLRAYSRSLLPFPNDGIEEDCRQQSLGSSAQEVEDECGSF
jgi:cytochrome P450